MKKSSKFISYLVLAALSVVILVPITACMSAKAAGTMDTTVTSGTTTASKAPKAVVYAIKAEKAGYADGTVTITPPDDTANVTNYTLYWGDDNGKLADYDAIVTLGRGITTYNMVANTYIPSNATRLLAYSCDGTNELPDFAACSIPESARMKVEAPINKFQVMSDLHITATEESYNKHLRNALKDIKAVEPDTDGIFTVGDNVDSCSPVIYNKLLSIIAQDGAGLPKINFGIGNHEYFDYIYGGAMTVNQKAAMYLEKTGAPGLYYDKYINGQHFITLGSEYYASVDANISDAQFTWLEKKLAETKYDKKPIFLFLHQSMADTVAGSIGGKAGQGWNGMQPAQETRMRAILAKYPQVVLFNGHSHWDVTSPHEMYDGGTSMPDIFNDGSVGYLWGDADAEVPGSQGFFVESYADKILVRGRDFENHKWIPSAAFVVDLNEKYSVIEGNWAYKAIMEMVNAGVLHGYGDGSLMPDAYATRAQFATMLKNMVKEEAKTTASFSDTPSTAWYIGAVSLAVEKGWIRGNGDGSFKPDNFITREEAMSIISRLLTGIGVANTFDSSVLNGYTDASRISDWAKADVEKLVGLKIVTGSNGLLKPKAQITRAEICAILSRVMKDYLNK